tara:strand:+ start:869 stop:1531 length:663 start_codon:yes stop_codon:yes gene_type:complete
MNEKETSKLLKVHLGCGKNALDGFLNYDNNLFLLFKYIPFIENFLSLFNFVPKWFCEFITIAREKDIKYCDASKKIPFKDSSVDLIYSCHMLEHLDKSEAEMFFNESYRVLKTRGIMRLVVPDFQRLIEKYNIDNDVETFIRGSCLVGKKPKTIIKKLQYLIQGHGWHHQMFNKDSLKVFKKLKFSLVESLEPGETNLQYSTSIDYNERKHESLYFEFIK